MPYATRRRARRSYRRNTGARKTSTRTRRTYRRSYTARTPRYRKRRTMPKRRILNLTSRKKRDQMAPISNMLGGSPAPYSRASSPSPFLDHRGRYRTDVRLDPNRKSGPRLQQQPRDGAQPHHGTAHTTYMVGLSENLLFQTKQCDPVELA